MKELFSRVFTALLVIQLYIFGACAGDINYTYSKDQGLYVNFDDLGKVKIGADVECGFVRDGALYASFGVEAQIFKCSKVVLSFDGITNNAEEAGNWFFKLDVAPLYESIKVEKKERKIYKKDSKGNDIDGNNHYVDWYKNLGSRLYYLGNIPLIEAYIGYKNTQHQIKLGRVKTIMGLADEEVFFGDDAKFAPMGHWLTRDLFSGIDYGFSHSLADINVALYSGGNPTKGYSYYLGGVETPNLKSNNTPSFAGKVKLKYSEFLGEDIDGYVFASYLSNMTGSTWDNETQDGKRNASVIAYGATFKFNTGNKYLNSIGFFGQYNQYISGLREKGSQNDGSKKFKDIKQSGYFIGTELKGFDDKISLGAAYEKIDRFDYNLFQYYNFADNNPFKNSKQTSLILQAKYNISSIVSLVMAYHKISNKALFASDILDTRKTNRMKIGLRVAL